MNARDVVLGRIRDGLGRKTGDRGGAFADTHTTRERGPLPTIGEPIARFRARAEALASTVIGPVARADAPAAVAEYLSTHGLPRTAVCWPAVRTLDWETAGIRVEARAATATDLVGVTGVYCAIAETGTLMLLSGAETPATTSLLPETHVALVPTTRVVIHMEDAWDLLRRELGTPPRAVTFISGPSRTADIEQTVTLGAHGPYRVLIVLLADR